MENLSIRYRILAALLLVGIIPLVLLGYFNYQSSSNMILNNELDKVSLFNDQLQDRFESYFNKIERDLLFLENNIENETIRLQEEQFSPLLKSSLEQTLSNFALINPEYDQIRLINKEGHEEISIQRQLNSINIVENGNLKNISDTSYFNASKLLNKNETYVSQIDLKIKEGLIEDPHNPIIRFVRPIAINNEVESYLVFNLRLDHLLNILKDIIQSSDYPNTYFTNEDGYYLIHNNSEKLWGFEKGFDNANNAFIDYPLIKEEETIGTNQMVSEEQVVLWQTFSVSKLNNNAFMFIQEINDIDFTKPLLRFERLFLLQLAINLVLVIAIGFRLSNLIKEPIDTIVDSVIAIGKGEFDTPIQVSGGKEINTLGYEIKKMAFELDNLYENLEKRVSERTNELELTQKKLIETANTDPLTGLFNRHYFNNYIQNFKTHEESEHINLVILILDIDKFKNINDTYGHNVGDDILVVVSNILIKVARESDFVVRYGGDEFLIALYNCGIHGAHHYIERLNTEIEKWNNNQEMIVEGLEISIGYSEFHQSKHIIDVINEADAMMYENKMKRRKNN